MSVILNCVQRYTFILDGDFFALINVVKTERRTNGGTACSEHERAHQGMMVGRAEEQAGGLHGDGFATVSQKEAAWRFPL